MRISVILFAIFSYEALACYSPPDPKYPAPQFLDMSFMGEPWNMSPFAFMMERFEAPHKVASYTPDMTMEQYIAALGAIKVEVAKTEYYVSGGDGVCQSNSFENALMLIRRAEKEGVTSDDLARIARARSAVLNRCGSKLDKAAVLSQLKDFKSEKAQSFGKYIEALVALYGQEFGKASELFEALTKSNTSQWVQETATYLKARVSLIESQQKWDGYGDTAAVDKNKVKEADERFKAYVVRYPSGIYADSAKNMQRRIYFMAGEQEKLNEIVLARAHEALLASNESANFGPAFNEFRTHFKGKVDASKNHPILIAYAWMKMGKATTDDMSNLAKNPLRSRYPHLFSFLTAYGLDATDQTDALVKMSNDYKTSDLLSVSVEVLRATAHEKRKEYDKATELWIKLKKDFPKEDAPELHLLSILLGQKAKDRIFDVDSPITNPKLLTDLAMTLYDIQALRALTTRKTLDDQKRVFIAREMMRRQLFERHYASMAKLFDTKGMEFAVLAPLEKDIRALNQNPGDLESLMKVGTYVYENHIQLKSDISGRGQLYENDLAKFCPDCVAGNEPARFVAYDYFKDVAQALHKQPGKSDLEAQALHFLVKCHRCCEWSDRCGAKGEGSSKGWFTRLHKKYAGSTWAHKTPYYY